jgi:hypothetical protein
LKFPVSFWTAAEAANLFFNPGYIVFIPTKAFYAYAESLASSFLLNKKPGVFMSWFHQVIIVVSQKLLPIGKSPFEYEIKPESMPETVISTSGRPLMPCLKTAFAAGNTIR